MAESVPIKFARAEVLGKPATTPGKDFVLYLQRGTDIGVLDRLFYMPPEDWWWQRYRPSIRHRAEDAKGLLTSMGFTGGLIDQIADPKTSGQAEKQKLHAGILHQDDETRIILFTIIPRHTIRQIADATLNNSCFPHVRILNGVQLVNRIDEGRPIKQIRWGIDFPESPHDQSLPGRWWNIRYADQLPFTLRTLPMLQAFFSGSYFSPALVEAAFGRYLAARRKLE